MPVFIPFQVRKAIYLSLFNNNGVAIEVTNRTQQVPEITYKNEKGEDTHPRNLYVNIILKSMKSKGYVKQQFAWNHYYYMLTADGEQFLKQELMLPETARPESCLKKISVRPEGERQARGGYGNRRFDRQQKPTEVKPEPKQE